MKFALVSPALPPSPSGQAMMLYNLLKDLRPGDYCLISEQDYDAGVHQTNYSGRLPGRYYRQADFQSIRRKRFRPSKDSRGESLHVVGIVHKYLHKLGIVGENPDEVRFRLARWRELVNLSLAPLGIVVRSRQIASIVKREGCGAVIACSGDLLNLPAGYLASRLAAVPFYPYLFDFYSCHWIHPLVRFFARGLEPIALKGAADIIVPNEALREELRRRYGVEATVIHNPCDVSQYESVPTDEPSWSSDELSIVYTGAIYRAHFDAFRNLLAAIEMLDQPKIRLHLYGAHLPRDLDDKGIRGPVVHHEHQPIAAMPGIQQQANLLFLPLAFNSPYPELIRTSAPGKMGEYLAAGRPIVAHAPPDSFVTWYFRRYECGLVVDQSDPAQLAQAIEQALTDASLRQRLGARARERARSDFSIAAAQSTFARLLKLDYHTPGNP